MRRFLIKIQYLGKNYKGFQLQKNTLEATIQGEIEKALKQVFKEDIKIFASGRLDGGANAEALTAHFDSDNKIATYKVAGAINHFLPSDISIIDAKEVETNFHARYNVKQKTYRYNMYVSRYSLPLIDDRAMQILNEPDISLMQQASKFFIGKHDFSSFMNKGSSIKTTVREVKTLEIIKHNNMITVSICGSGFLYNMVRIIVGTLLDAGYKKIEPIQVKDILVGKNRALAGKMVEAKGLTLLSVEY
ncbi:MAG: tRNA pseudouridine(38-40) synthase TruA [Clostridia bacterium]|nr:tRNA pseudouridine(38-40) synthase TruA [Clostridia bacterium]